MRSKILIFGTGAAFLLIAVASVAALTLSSGNFTGSRENALYGFVRVKAQVDNGRLTNVKILEYPHHASHSLYISQVALPYLIREAVNRQNSQVDWISGATFTSRAFQRSLTSALRQAQN